MCQCVCVCVTVLLECDERPNEDQWSPLMVFTDKRLRLRIKIGSVTGRRMGEKDGREGWGEHLH